MLDEGGTRGSAAGERLVTLMIDLPGRPGPDGAVRLVSRRVPFARLPGGGWRSVPACFAARLVGPYAEAVHHRALHLDGDAAGPRPPAVAAPVTAHGRAAATVLRRTGRTVAEIPITIGDSPARIFGWADEWPGSPGGRFHEEPLEPALWAADACPGCGVPVPATGRRCPACHGAMPPVVARALMLRDADRGLLFWDTETTGLARIGLDRRIVGPAPRIWDLAWLARGARPGGRASGERVVLRGEPLPRRVAILSGVPADSPTRGGDPVAGLRAFLRAGLGRVLVGHNAALYDEPVLVADAAAHGVALPDLDRPGRTFDTLPLARALLPTGEPGSPPSHRLGDLAAHLGVAPPESGYHTAAADVAVTAGVWDALVALALEAYGGERAALAEARRVDRVRDLPELYGWLRHECPECHHAEWTHRPFEGPCSACRTAARPYAVVCPSCGETERLERPPWPRFTCRICREAAVRAAGPRSGQPEQARQDRDADRGGEAQHRGEAGAPSVARPAAARAPVVHQAAEAAIAER